MWSYLAPFLRYGDLERSNFYGNFVNQTIACALYLLEMLPESVRQFVDNL